MSKKYGAKFREIYNRETKQSRDVYSAVIYSDSALNGEMLVASKGEILEFKNKEDALEEARKTYEKFKWQLWD
ncbi:hypothetical protein C672_3578 [[Clostridium] bifermentans ATCC 638]|uniref:Uncharacterized protein n=1 Tax=Paraclostridium bifermentans ATCC 638 = DSM 14991 TaxID=1233171 RepID=T4VGD4_PARBF|nr:hypothetical protein [Paraclostridium bifermentans]EQK39826.1 hypothetical protein C672_3578 [[Clostridium] bifermentans ATCC 638] [Paraclostridium bifermentans ATCC 638 = DSM 14991]RIZ57409.1 hypothetical protein CHH45_16360 [Paraclostridium bifermentans]